MEYPKGLGTIWPEDEAQKPVTAYFTPPKEKNYPVKWLLLWQDESEIGVSMVEQAKSAEMTLTDYRVRDFLMGTIGLGNFVFVNQAEVARGLNVHRISVVRSIKRLCDMQILVRGPKSGRSNTYMVNPAFCFAGSLGKGVKERTATIKQGRAKAIPFKQEEQLNLLQGV
jgi:hypothetical protein